MRWLRVMALVMVITSCTGGTDTVVESVSPTTPPRTQPPTSPPLPPDALPVPEPSPWAIRSNDARSHPDSADAAIGESQKFTLSTHCGINFRVDFDGSFWQAYNVREKLAASNPFQKGSMTLLTGDVAVFRFKSGGGEEAVYFVRNDSPKPVGACW